MSGPPKTPPRLHLIRGNPSKRPVKDPKKTAKKDEKGLPKIPQHLGSQGKYWFRRMAEELNAEGIISQLDARALELLVEAYTEYPNKQRGVWVEGSAGVALLARRLGDDATAMDILARLAPLRTRYGYIDSCDYPDNDDMPAWPSSCNTAWMILACDPQGFWNVDSPATDVGYYLY